MMTKKDYQAVAAVIVAEFMISESTAARIAVRNIAFSLADRFAQGNPRFDRAAFYSACGIHTNR